MKAVLQRVRSARVTVDDETISEIGQGLLILLGVEQGDDVEQADFLAEKAAALRVFEDGQGKLNRSLVDIEGGMLVVSNFTLCADARHGRRPSFSKAAPAPVADSLYQRFVAAAKDAGVKPVYTGVFGADMQVSLQNDGPVTIFLDTAQIMKPEK